MRSPQPWALARPAPFTEGHGPCWRCARTWLRRRVRALQKRRAPPSAAELGAKDRSAPPSFVTPIVSVSSGTNKNKRQRQTARAQAERQQADYRQIDGRTCAAKIMSRKHFFVGPLSPCTNELPRRVARCHAVNPRGATGPRRGSSRWPRPRPRDRSARRRAPRP